MAERLKTIKSHLTFPQQENPLNAYRVTKINKDLLREAYYQPVPEMTKLFFEVTAAHPNLFNQHKYVEEPREKQREITFRQLVLLYPLFYSRFDFTNSYYRALFGVTLTQFDQALATRYMVNAILYAETVDFLGTEKHKILIERSCKLKDYGSFAMTEIGHGSNVAGSEVTATYLPETREFLINSTTPLSMKFWIGAAAHTANMTVLFANLVIGGTKYGINVFAIRIRDDNHELMPGVFIGDCGPKAGLEGIDNGFIIFKDMRVPYDTLLDRISQVTPEGKFKSNIKSEEKRFGITLSGLTGGRSCILGSAEANYKKAVTIAVRYSALRSQFGKGRAKEVELLKYPLHKYRVLPHLAKLLASRVTFQYMISIYANRKALVKTEPECTQVEEMHALVSGFKYLVPRYTQIGIQDCREACGGQAYSAFGGFMRIRENNDIHLTWDGDNTILLMQTTKFLIKSTLAHFKGKPVSTLLTFFNATKPAITLESLKTPETLLAVLEFRAHHYLTKSTARLQAVASKDPSVALENSHVHHYNNFSISFLELIISKQVLEFATKIRAQCAESGKAVENLFRLYVLNAIEKDHFGLSEEEILFVEQAIVAECEEASLYAVDLVDAFALPDHLNGSVLGQSDGRAYESFYEQVEAAPGVYDKPGYLQLIKDMKKTIN